MLALTGWKPPPLVPIGVTVDDAAVLAGFFRDVEGVVGLVEKLLIARAVLALEEDGASDAYAVMLVLGVVQEKGLQLLGHLPDLLLDDVPVEVPLHQDDELIPAEPADEVRGPAAVKYAVPRVGDEEVPDGVAEAVVDVLEVVYVYDEEAALAVLVPEDAHRALLERRLGHRARQGIRVPLYLDDEAVGEVLHAAHLLVRVHEEGDQDVGNHVADIVGKECRSLDPAAAEEEDDPHSHEEEVSPPRTVAGQGRQDDQHDDEGDGGEGAVRDSRVESVGVADQLQHVESHEDCAAGSLRLEHEAGQQVDAKARDGHPYVDDGDLIDLGHPDEADAGQDDEDDEEEHGRESEHLVVVLRNHRLDVLENLRVLHPQTEFPEDGPCTLMFHSSIITPCPDFFNGRKQPCGQGRNAYFCQFFLPRQKFLLVHCNFMRCTLVSF